MSDGDKVLAWIRDWLTDGGAILMIADYAFEALEGQAITIKIGGGAPVSRALYRLSDVPAAQKLVADLATLVPVSFAA